MVQNIDCIISGRATGCPFCSASGTKRFVLGERIRFLSGFRAGKEATVAEPSEMLKNVRYMILVQMDEDDLNTQQMVNLRFEILERFPSLQVPAWAPPISIRKTFELHERIIVFCERNSLGSVATINWISLYALIRHIWDKRLPLEPNEVWKILEAHGVPAKWRDMIRDIIKHGLSLLITMFGKKPIKKFRVQPMEVTLSSKYGFSE